MPNVTKYDCYSTGLIDKGQIKKLRESMSPSLFAANYEMKHIADENAMFPDPLFISDVSMLYDGVAHIDAAYGGEDYTAYTIIKKIQEGRYIAYGKLWDKHVDDCIEEIRALHEIYRAGSISCEKNADKGYLAKELKGKGFEVNTYSESMNKYLKISTYLRAVWNSILWLDDTDPEYLNQILDYTENAAHDDAPDSAASLIRNMNKRNTHITKRIREEYKMFRVPKGTEMTTELLAKYIGQHKLLESERLQRLQDAYENKYDVFDFTKHPKKPDFKPDNRIAVNHAKFIVDTFNGFFTGIPIKITVSEDNEGETERISGFLKYLESRNNLDNKNRELAKLSDILGSANEIYFTDEDGEIGSMQVSRLESFFIYDESILTRPMFFVRYYKDAESVERGSWSDSKVVQKFVNDGSYKWVEGAEPHYFDGVPATKYPENT